jgi:HEPN domain-containing protein
LAIEKEFKAIMAKRGMDVPRIHDLPKSAEIVGMDLSDEEESELEEVTLFNINARYEDYKNMFYKKATVIYTTKWKEIGRKWFERLEGML